MVRESDFVVRMRKKKNLVPRLGRCEGITVTDPASMKGNWRSLFPEAKELYVELGCGKGRFSVEMAKLNPDVLYVALEREPSAVVTAMESAMREGLKNLYFVVADAVGLSTFFAPGEVNRLFINFCDPWTHGHRIKRRLTHRNFLFLYAQILAADAHLCFKTDNQELFVFSVVEAVESGLKVIDITHDLHKTSIPNVMTEYETKFSSAGLPIYRMEAVFPGEMIERALERASEMTSDQCRDPHEGLRRKRLPADPGFNSGADEDSGVDSGSSESV